jgi:hypothetical protein
MNFGVGQVGPDSIENVLGDAEKGTETIIADKRIK